ncbi:hypothetical protein EXT84_27585, partial [Klebsiella quasipneumoniae subsp. similipneumoniae]
VCVVGKMRDLILQLSKSSIYSTKPLQSSTAIFCPYPPLARLKESGFHSTKGGKNYFLLQNVNAIVIARVVYTMAVNSCLIN